MSRGERLGAHPGRRQQPLDARIVLPRDDVPVGVGPPLLTAAERLQEPFSIHDPSPTEGIDPTLEQGVGHAAGGGADHREVARVAAGGKHVVQGVVEDDGTGADDLPAGGELPGVEGHPIILLIPHQVVVELQHGEPRAGTPDLGDQRAEQPDHADVLALLRFDRAQRVAALGRGPAGARKQLLRERVERRETQRTLAGVVTGEAAHQRADILARQIALAVACAQRRLGPRQLNVAQADGAVLQLQRAEFGRAAAARRLHVQRAHL